MSPYLFLIVADVLQQLIKSNIAARHPLADDTPCPVLQYADDTLIILRGELSDVTAIKQALDDFSSATGLHINFGKSTIVPMHVPEADMPPILAHLGCRREGFPQTYLGLPLSNEKLRLTHFAPMLSKN